MSGGLFFVRSMACFVYILQNAEGRYYIGQTDDLERRVEQHNAPQGKEHLGKYTHRNGPWRLVAWEGYESRGEAMVREKGLKKLKSGRKAFLAMSGSVVESRQGRD